MTNQIAMLDWAGDDAFDVFLGNRFVGIIARASTNAVRCYFNSTATAGSARRFPDAQTAVAYLLARRERRIEKRAAKAA
jgi:hypothetical protein